MTNWYRDSSFFEKEQALISEFYPSLEYIQIDNSIKLKGELYIKEIDDSYTIEISFLDNYPKTLPIVKEMGGDIPKTDQRHINFGGSCCLCIPQLQKIYFPDGSNIKDFLDNLVVPFFANQAYYDLNATWLNGEYSHGYMGIYEFYSDFLDIKNFNKTLQLLQVSIQSIPNFNKKCPCHSGRSIRKCHMQRIVELKKLVKINQLKDDVYEFKKIKEKKEL